MLELALQSPLYDAQYHRLTEMRVGGGSERSVFAHIRLKTQVGGSRLIEYSDDE
jgi:hypothetical protein